MKYWTLGISILALAVTTSVPAAAQETDGQVPDLKVVGWTVDDTAVGNGDGGLHPGEEAEIVIYLSNQGNEPARNVSATLNEVVDHPDVEIIDKFVLWPDLPGTGAPAPSFDQARVRVTTTRPCGWEIPLRLEILAANGYFETREFTLTMVDPQRVDLAEENARPFYYGVDPGDTLGGAIASGDLDGDGFDDLILGARSGDGPSNGRPSAGEVAVVYGGPSPPPDVDLAAVPPGIALVYGADSSDFLGQSIATGDLDGDGFDDLILGANGGDGSANVGDFNGEVVVIYGGPTRFADIDLASPPAGVAFVYGADSDDELGWSAASGDLDGDGYDDLILGANRGDGPANGRPFAGEVVVVYGRPSRFVDIDLASPPAGVFVVYGEDSSHETGFSVACGDLDGDGYDELLLGAYLGGGPANDRFGAGEVVVVYGGPWRLADIDLASPPSGVAFVYGADGDDLLGVSVTTGDLDGNGYDDLVVGANGGDGPANGRSGAGEVIVIYGAPSRLADIDLASPPPGVTLVFGADSSDFLGSVATGDLDGDGYDDVLVGASGDGPANGRTDAGEIVTIYGGPSPLVDVDLASPPADVTFVYGADSDDRLRTSVASDLDGDGYDELILGAAFGDGPANGRSGSGEVAVIPGAPRSRYRHDPDAFSFIDATLGTDLGLDCDDCGATIPIGFKFDFYGRKYDEVTVSSNGYVTFGTGPANQPGGLCPPASSPPDDLIAVFWDDLNPAAGGAIYSLLEGTEPNRRLTIQWDQVPLYPNTDAATFEVTLFETSDQILVQYQDVDFGGSVSDFGGNAIIGVEAVSGANGTALSCKSAGLVNAQANRFRRFASPTVTYSDDFESGPGSWTASGLWHLEDDSASACTPASRSGDFSFYYGQSGICDYQTGVANSGTLISPTLANLPQDAELRFWQRHQTEFGFEQTQVDVLNGGAGGTVDLSIAVTDGSDAWRFSDDFGSPFPTFGLFTNFDLSSFAGQDIAVQFFFDTMDDINNSFTGWMIDDVTVRACPVFGGGAADGVASEARATPQPDVYCEGQPGRVDALGSYCAACSTLQYQWSRDGAAVVGATGVAYDIPASDPPGIFDYTVEISCSANAGCTDTSDAAAVEIVQQPSEVGPTLMVDKINAGLDLDFRWTDVAGADDYVLRSDTIASGGFADVAGSATSGVTGIALPVPTDDVVFYVLSGRNPVCGEGPR